MVKVRIWGSLAKITGSETVCVDGGIFIELLNNLKKDRKVSIEEVVVAEEKVVFKLPKELN